MLAVRLLLSSFLFPLNAERTLEKLSCFLWLVFRKRTNTRTTPWNKEKTSCLSLVINSSPDTSHNLRGKSNTLLIRWWAAVYNIRHHTITPSTSVKPVLTVMSTESCHTWYDLQVLAMQCCNPVFQGMWFCDLFKKKRKKEKGADHVMIKRDDIAHWLWRDKDQWIHRHRGVGESPNEKHTLQLHD